MLIVINLNGLDKSAVKFLCKLRDGNQCQINKLLPHISCNSSSLLEIHHIKTQKNGGGDNPENLITLCAVHHSMIHKVASSRLAAIMEEHSISQSDLAGALGVSQSAISQALVADNLTLRRAKDILGIINSLTKRSYNLYDL